MRNPIKEIVQFNKKAGLLDKPYDDFLESSFQVEEALEGFDLAGFSKDFNNPKMIANTDMSPKELSRNIVESVNINGPLTDVERLDKACDAVVYAIGSMAKLRLTAQDITAALNVVIDANNTKLSMPKDEHGKLMKPDNFIGPEARLQLILDKRP